MLQFTSENVVVYIDVTARYAATMLRTSWVGVPAGLGALIFVGGVNQTNKDLDLLFVLDPNSTHVTITLLKWKRKYRRGAGRRS